MRLAPVLVLVACRRCFSTGGDFWPHEPKLVRCARVGASRRSARLADLGNKPEG